jgi:hypothetical protein
MPLETLRRYVAAKYTVPELMTQIHSDMLAHLLELWDRYDTDKDDNM